MNSKKLLKIIASGLFLTAGLYLSLNALLAAVWNEPSASPVAGNAPRPLHEGTEGQVKEGSLGLMTGLFVGEFGEGMVVSGGSKMVTFGPNANLFDNTEPLTLEVDGNIGATEYCDELGNACSFIGHGVPKAYALDSKENAAGVIAHEEVVYVGDDSVIFIGQLQNPSIKTDIIDKINPTSGKLYTYVLGGANVILEGLDPTVHFEVNWNIYDNYIKAVSDKLIFSGKDRNGVFTTMFYLDQYYKKMTVLTDLSMLENPTPQIHFSRVDAGNIMAYWEMGITENSFDGNHFKIRGDDSIIQSSPGADKDWIVFNGPNKAVGINMFEVGCPACKLDINGDMRARESFLISDIREKENIEIIKNALSKTLSLNGTYFFWKDPEKGDDRQIGLIAQEVEKILPELVTDDFGGYLGLNYENLSALLIEAVKEYTVQSDNRLIDLESENEVLKKYACKLKPGAEICK